MSKLHEILAVEGDLEGAYKRIIEESIKTFSSKPGLFYGFSKRLEMFEEGAPTPPEENQELTTTVKDRLDYTVGHIIRYLDAVLQKEATNQKASADIVFDGVTIARDVPATFLLGLESKLKSIRRVYDAMPTLPTGRKWELDAISGSNIYKDARVEEKFKTAKTFKHKVLVPAQFPAEGEGGTSLPAQIERWEEVENVGRYITSTMSGMITSAEKSKLIGRLDKMLRAVKKARQRANTTTVLKIEIGEAIFNYIND